MAREFWIWNTGFSYITYSEPIISDTPVYHVIEKSAADKLAEALGQLMKIPGNVCREYDILKHDAVVALKEYRGEE